MSQAQCHVGFTARRDPDVVFPLRSHPQTLGAHLVQALPKASDPEVPAPIRSHGVRCSAVRCLPKYLRECHSSSLAAKYDSIQGAFDTSAVRQNWGQQ
jgi:hypothetical protein